MARYLQAAEYFDDVFGVDPIVRVTADCPLIDPGVLNSLVRHYHANPGSFVTNNLERSFPHGLDAEVFSLAMLRMAAEQTGEDYDAEHVTQWMRRQPGAINLKFDVDLSHVRITLDTKDDLRLIRDIYHSLSSKDFITTADVLWLLEHRPDLARLAREAA